MACDGCEQGEVKTRERFEMTVRLPPLREDEIPIIQSFSRALDAENPEHRPLKEALFKIVSEWNSCRRNHPPLTDRA